MLPTNRSVSEGGGYEEKATQCMFYNVTVCVNGCPRDKDPCKPDHNQCYSVWKNESGKISVQYRGCLGSQENNQCSEPNRCVAVKKRTDPDLFFCCCQSSLCNKEELFLPVKELAQADGKIRQFSEAILRSNITFFDRHRFSL